MAAGALTLGPVYADASGTMGGDATMSGDMGTGGDMTMTGDMSTNMGGDMSMGGNMTMGTSAPMPVSGQVLRYYTDRAGMVTAMDVQTAEGVRMVRFSPGMGQRLYTTYPAGGNIDAYIVNTNSPGMSRYDLVGLGTEEPRAGFMTPYMTSDTDLLEAEPFITAGASQVQVQGELVDVVTNKRGEVLALVVDARNAASVEMLGSDMKSGGDMSMGGGGSMGGDASMGGDMSMGGGSMGGDMSMGGMGMMGGGMGMMGNRVLIRVGREFRHINPGEVGGSRIAQLFKGSDVKVVGYPEASRYGAMSSFGQRIIASALVINGRSVGAVGIPRLTPAGRAVFNINMAGTNEDESRARSMGYIPYNTGVMSGDMTMGGDMSGTGTMGGTDMGGGTGTGMGGNTDMGGTGTGGGM